MRRLPPRTTRTDTLCPDTTLFRSLLVGDDQAQAGGTGIDADQMGRATERRDKSFAARAAGRLGRSFADLTLFTPRRRQVEAADEETEQDRKSTRLNSSH